MSAIYIQGGHCLNGELYIQGAKNAALPIMAASLLNSGVTCLRRCPEIADVMHMCSLLEQMGVRVKNDNGQMILDASEINPTDISALDAGTMRSSVLLLGPLLGRKKEVMMPYPGGCTIGARPVNWHIEALQKMNVQVSMTEEGIYCRTLGIKGTKMRLPYPSVGVTENVIMAAVLAEGHTEILNAAMEPEIEDLCRFLAAAGARIDGIGTNRINITGVEKLHDICYTIMADRIAAGTYMTAAAAAGGEITLRGIRVRYIQSIADILAESGCGLIIYEESIKIIAPSVLLGVKNIQTQPYPGFPTDMQSQMMACLCSAHGESCITENIFEDRYKIVPELIKMGADISVEGNRAFVRGIPNLHGEVVTARDLRGGAALVVAGLAAEGMTTVQGGEHIERGYVDLCRNLCLLGAEIDCEIVESESKE